MLEHAPCRAPRSLGLALWHKEEMTRVIRSVILIAMAALASRLVGCVSIYVAPPPAQFTVIETDVEVTRRTMAEMRRIATAVESYAIDRLHERRARPPI